jgi:hypothetical protein
MQGLLDDHQIQQHNFSRRVCAQVLDILDGRTKGHPYIFFTSFSEEIDTLEMWREYGNKGQGYALRFERMKLMRGAPKRAILEKVIYHPQKVEEALDAFTESLAAILLGVDGVNFDAILIDNVTSYVSRSCWAMAAMIKHQAYRNEKEWRMVRICDSDEDYKSVVSGHNDRGLKPHFKGPQVSESGLEAVYLGSGLDKIQERDLRVKLDNLGITGLDLIWSTIPLKGRGT